MINLRLDGWVERNRFLFIFLPFYLNLLGFFLRKIILMIYYDWSIFFYFLFFKFLARVNRSIPWDVQLITEILRFYSLFFWFSSFVWTILRLWKCSNILHKNRFFFFLTLISLSSILLIKFFFFLLMRSVIVGVLKKFLIIFIRRFWRLLIFSSLLLKLLFVEVLILFHWANNWKVFLTKL